MPTPATAKEERQYRHILESEVKAGKSKKTAKRIAAATVNKRRAAKKAAKKPARRAQRNGLYAYQVSVIQPGEGARRLGAFPAKSRAEALQAAENELKRKGQWYRGSKLLTAAVPLNSTAGRHSNGKRPRNANPDKETLKKLHDRAYEQATAADDAWTAELKKVFKRSAGDARYDKRGKSTPLLKKLAADFQRKAAKLHRVSSRLIRASNPRNAEHRDASHPIHVRQYWQGRKGYKTPWQRAHEAGQGQLFKMKNGRKRRNSATAEENRREFSGTFSGYKELYFAANTPTEGLSTLGPLVLIKTDAGLIKPVAGTAVLCQDAKGKLYIGSKTAAPLIDGAARNFGAVHRVEYVCAKPHLGYPEKVTWFHDFESPLPHLKSDGAGGLHFHGGGYTIRREGITG